ncbi:hypothetical protein STEPF1_05640 [Streptomyces sp. F-1]|nr:hypothetical protein STEPF1_05640 [Streptomyces sp. F-1]
MLLGNDPVLNSLGGRTTTNTIQLALWAGSGPVVVFATYASLVDHGDIEAPEGQRKVRGPLEAALAGGDRLYGRRMAGFDLAIVDEARGTAGDLGRPWAAIHDSARTLADFRLCLTATPRILAAARPQKGATMASSTSAESLVSAAASCECRWSSVRGPTSALVTPGGAVTKPSASRIIVRPASSATPASRSTASNLARLEEMLVSKRCGMNVERLVVISLPSRIAPDSQTEASGLHTGTPSPYCSVTGSTWVSMPRCGIE